MNTDPKPLPDLMDAFTGRTYHPFPSVSPHVNREKIKASRESTIAEEIAEELKSRKVYLDALDLTMIELVVRKHLSPPTDEEVKRLRGVLYAIGKYGANKGLRWVIQEALAALAPAQQEGK